MKKYIFGILCILFGVIYILLGKIPDFGIDDSFFNTKNYDKDYYSNNNGFTEYKELIGLLDSEEELLTIFSNKSKCIGKMDSCSLYKNILKDEMSNLNFVLNKNSREYKKIKSFLQNKKHLEGKIHYYKNDKGKKEVWEKKYKDFLNKNSEIINSKYFKDYELFVKESILIEQRVKKEFIENFYNIDNKKINRFKILSIKYLKLIKNIKQKDFIKSYTSKTSLGDQSNSNISYINIVKIARAINFLVLYELHNGNKTFFQELLSLNLDFNTYLFNNADLDLLGNMVIITNLDIAYDLLYYLIDNEGNNYNKDNVKKIIGEEILNEGMIINGIKVEYLRMYNFLDNITFVDRFKIFNDYNNISHVYGNKLAPFGFLFSFNISDSKKINKKIYYDIISTKKKSNYIPPFSLRNAFGNHIIIGNQSSYEYQFKKEAKLIMRQNELINKARYLR